MSALEIYSNISNASSANYGMMCISVQKYANKEYSLHPFLDKESMKSSNNTFKKKSNFMKTRNLWTNNQNAMKIKRWI